MRFQADALRGYISISRDGVSFDLHWIYGDHRLVPSSNRDQCHLPSARVLTSNGRHLIYYESCPSPHETRKMLPCTINLVSYRQDGLLYLEASDGEGEVVTHWFIIEGDSLMLNVDRANTTLDWHVKVGLFEVSGKDNNVVRELEGYLAENTLALDPGKDIESSVSNTFNKL